MNKKAFAITLAYTFFILLAIVGSILLIVRNSDISLNYTISENKILEKEYDNDFKTLNIDMDAGKIEIKNKNIDNIKVVVYSEKKNVKVSKDEDLIIKSSKMKKCKWICINKIIPRVVVYVPKEFNNNVIIKDNMGNIKIEKLNKAKIKNNLGDIKIKKINSISIDNDLGDIKINKINKYCYIKADMGDIKIDDLNITKSSKLVANLGDIEIGKTNEIYIDTEMDLGDVKINNNYRKADVVLKIKIDMGDIKVDN